MMKREKGTAFDMDRRGFLKVAAGIGATAAAAAALPGCAPAENASKSAQGAAAAGASTAGTPSWLGEAPEIDEASIVDTIEADIVIVGGGNAGTMCATAATEAGAKVAVLEAQDQKTMTYYGLHDIANLNSHYLLDHGIESVKVSEFVAEYQRRNRNKTNPRLVKQYAENSGEMLDWIVERAPQNVVDALVIENEPGSYVGDDYFNEGAEINGYKCYRGCVQVNFQDTAPVLIEAAEAAGSKWYWQHTGVKLITEETTESVKTTVFDKDSNTISEKMVDTPCTRVTAVIAQDADGAYHKFVGTKGIVLACGDYGGNHDMYYALQDERRALYESHGLDVDEMKCKVFGRDGSGIKMGMWAGGSIDPSPHCLVSPQVIFDSEDFPTNVLRWGAGFKVTADRLAAGAGGASQNPWGAPFVCLDMNGNRFTDEAFLGIFGTLDQVERRKPGRYFYFFDNKWKKMMSKMPPEHFSQPIGIADATDYDKLFQSWVDRGAEGAETEDGGTVCAWGANSLDELLGYMGFDDAMKKSVTESIDQYNAYCAQGEDEDFGRDPKLLLDVSEPPFFGMYSVEEKPMLGTVALNGLVIDDDQRVLDKNYNPILGLYASGNNSGGRFAVQYSTAISGLTLGMAMTLGRVLGKALAKK